MSSAGYRLQVSCQGKDEQKKSLTQQNKDRLIIVGTSKLFHPLLVHRHISAFHNSQEAAVILWAASAVAGLIQTGSLLMLHRLHCIGSFAVTMVCAICSCDFGGCDCYCRLHTAGRFGRCYLWRRCLLRCVKFSALMQARVSYPVSTPVTRFMTIP